MSFILLFKALHLIFMVTWFAGLFYLPRLFVYHKEALEKNQHQDVVHNFIRMERKLYTIIMNPSMMIVWVCGLLLIVSNSSYLKEGWLHVKLTLVVVLTAYHLILKRYRLLLEQGHCQQSSRFFRVLNEIPSVFLIIIVFLAVYRPF